VRETETTTLAKPPKNQMKTIQVLNVRQERFVLEYLKDCNGTQAAIRAGYSRKGAEVHAHRLLRNLQILNKIRAVHNRTLQSAEVSVERVLREYACVAFFDPAKLFDSEGNLLPIDQMPEDARRALNGLESQEIFDFERGSKTHVGTLRKVRFASKIGALDALAKHLGILRDRVEHSGPGGGPISIIELREEIFRMMGESEAGEAKEGKGNDRRF
jgi:phage terminase small subunit